MGVTSLVADVNTGLHPTPYVSLTCTGHSHKIMSRYRTPITGELKQKLEDLNLGST